MNCRLRCAILSFVALVLVACAAPTLPEPAAPTLRTVRLSTQTAADTAGAVADTGGNVETEDDGQGTTASESDGRGIGTLGSGN
jgi:hypothetical protein